MAGKKEDVKFSIQVDSRKAVKALGELINKSTELTTKMKHISTAMRGDFMAKVVKGERKNAAAGTRLFEKANSAKVASMRQSVRKYEALGEDGMNAATDMSVQRMKVSQKEWKGDKKGTDFFTKNTKKKERVSKKLSKQYGTEVKDFEVAQGKYKPLISQRAKAEADLESSMKKQRTAAGMNNLTFLFLGQAITKTFTGIARSSMQTFSQISGDTNASNVEFKRMGVALDVIKFSLGSGFASLMQPWIPLLMKIAEHMLNMSESAKKNLARWTGIGLIMGYVIGFAANLGLIFMSLGNMGLLKGKLWTTFGSNMKGAFKTGITGAKLLWSKITTQMIPSIVAFGKKSWAAMAKFAAGGWAALLPWLPILIAVAAVVIMFVLLTKKLGSLGNAFKAVGIFFLAILAAIGDAIIFVMLTPLEAVINLINKVIKGLHRVGIGSGKTIEVGPAFDFGNLSKKVWKMRNDLIAEAEKMKAEQAAEDAASASPSQDNYTSKAEEDYMNSDYPGVVVNNTQEFNVNGNGDEFLEKKFNDMKADADKDTERIIQTYQSMGGAMPNF